MPKATTGGASNAWEELEPGAQPAPVAVAEVPADAEVRFVGEGGPELTDLPEGVTLLGTPGDMHGAEGLTVLKTAPESASPVAVASMSKAELQEHADSLGLPVSGSKADLAARIVEHHEAQGGVAEVVPEPDVKPEA